MNRKFILFASSIFLFAGLQNTNAQELNEKQCNDKLVSIFKDKAFYSSELCHKNLKNHITEKFYPTYCFPTNVVYLDYGQDVHFMYPRIRIAATKNNLDAMSSPHDLSEAAWPDLQMSHNANYKDNFHYIVSEGKSIYGVYKVSDKEYDLVYVPVFAGSNVAFDYDRVDCDLLFKDEASAMSANAGARKNELLAILKKNMGRQDFDKSEAEREKYTDIKPDPVGMHDPAIEKNLLATAQKLWTTYAGGGLANTEDLNKGKLTKIWITSNDWIPVRDDLDKIKYRYIVAEASISTPAGKCYLYPFTFMEDYMGGGTYSKQLKDGCSEALKISDGLKSIPCKNIK